ncbi:MAG: multifunctional transcriptional regulator/nicotinamide-nucleotide adenylyltransferase/ribosylnicotinamide kinase NadR [Candidatus Heimdallarchaeota archaeon]|nr:multifunctional transcriptional regulator/nicotinamide-nucleotide adenylyltransferase/ribosylnicotinamide kinase NadR [Candidatus Heimdallarchaeota archaeon]
MKKTGFFAGKFLPLHAGHLFVLAKASTYVDTLYFILTSSDVRDKYYCARDGIPYISPEQRLVWMGKAISDMENVSILHLVDDGDVVDDQDQYNWERGTKQVIDAIGTFTHVFSSESEYDPIFQQYYPFAEHIIIDSEKINHQISASDIRKNPFRYWEFLPSYVSNFIVKTIVVVGTESCGKSTLVKHLAKCLNTNYLPEVGREFCEEFSDQFTAEMFDHIVLDQLQRERELKLQSNKILIIDTEAVVTQYYLKIYLDTYSDLIENIIKRHRYDIYLYLEPDVEWVDDGLRFLGEDTIRKKNDDLLKAMFSKYNINYYTIGGSYTQRLDRSLSILRSLNVW